jgi:hypothetical protein
VSTNATVTVECRRAGEGWSCDVGVQDDRGTSRHVVSLRPADLAALDPSAAGPDRLVRASFEFLLERESKAAILQTFDLPVIGRYFPEYEATIRQRLAQAG